MIEKLRKKLMVLFLTCTMLIFTAAMLVMAGNAVSQIRSAEIQYGNNLADSILEQFSSRTLDFSVYTNLMPWCACLTAPQHNLARNVFLHHWKF